MFDLRPQLDRPNEPNHHDLSLSVVLSWCGMHRHACAASGRAASGKRKCDRCDDAASPRGWQRRQPRWRPMSVCPSACRHLYVCSFCVDHCGRTDIRSRTDRLTCTRLGLLCCAVLLLLCSLARSLALPAAAVCCLLPASLLERLRATFANNAKILSDGQTHEGKSALVE